MKGAACSLGDSSCKWIIIFLHACRLGMTVQRRLNRSRSCLCTQVWDCRSRSFDPIQTMKVFGDSVMGVAVAEGR